MFEILFSALWEIVLQIVSELVLESGYYATKESFRRRTRAHPGVAAIGVFLMGALGGLLSWLILPGRIVQRGPIPGLSLIVAPIVTGLVMDRWGEWRDSRGSERSFMATFSGGALFAFAMALVRFLLLKE